MSGYVPLRIFRSKQNPDQLFVVRNLPGDRKRGGATEVELPEAADEPKVENALFDVEQTKLAIVSDLFGDDRYFADADAFWKEQFAVIDERREAYLDEGWNEVVIVAPEDYFRRYEHARASKRDGGRVYIDVSANGEIAFYEGYVTSKEAKRLAAGEKIGTGQKVARPEVTSTMQSYIDLHRHAAARAALCHQPRVALRLMVAHAIAGSWLWKVKPEGQMCRNDAVRESVEVCAAETEFDAKRRAVLALLGLDPERPTVTHDEQSVSRDHVGIVPLFLRLLDLPDRAVMAVIVIVIGETLASGSAAVEAVGGEIGVDMARYWQADDAFFECLRDREVLTAIVAEVGGDEVAAANAGEKAKTLKAIVRDHLNGANGRHRALDRRRHDERQRRGQERAYFRKALCRRAENESRHYDRQARLSPRARKHGDERNGGTLLVLSAG